MFREREIKIDSLSMGISGEIEVATITFDKTKIRQKSVYDDVQNVCLFKVFVFLIKLLPCFIWIVSFVVIVIAQARQFHAKQFLICGDLFEKQIIMKNLRQKRRLQVPFKDQKKGEFLI